VPGDEGGWVHADEVPESQNGENSAGS